MTRYAAKTAVPVEKSRVEIERTLARYGAQQFIYGWDQEAAVIAFVAHGRQIRLRLPLPDKTARRFTHHSYGPRSQEAATKLWEQESRSAWRALALVVKAKLEAVEAGIATFEDEFLAYTMLPTGQTMGEWATPQLGDAYEKGQMPHGLPLLALEAGE